jgi:hypothetical protein
MKPKFIKDALLGFTAICALAGFISNASAATPTGTCGLVASIPHPELDWYAYINSTAPAATTKNMDLLAEINFTAKTINYSITQFTWSGTAFTKSTVAGNASFTIAGPGVNTTNTTPASYQITFTPSVGSTNAVTLNVLPVNSGNTYLIQGVADRLSGVCQMF